VDQTETKSAAGGGRGVLGGLISDQQALDVQMEPSRFLLEEPRRLVSIAMDGSQARPKGHRLRFGDKPRPERQGAVDPRHRGHLWSKGSFRAHFRHAEGRT
jgi:hypothetical protein